MCRVLLCTAIFTISATAQQEPPLIRVPVREVAVPTAVVSRDGRAVRELLPDQFVLLDNDRPQQFHLDYTDGLLSLAIVVQATSTVSAWLPQVRRVASEIEALLTGATGESSLTVFGDEVKLVQPLTPDTVLLDTAFSSIKARGSGNHLLDAIRSAAAILESADSKRRRVILVVAQPDDSGSAASLHELMDRLELRNIVVYSLEMPMMGADFIGRTVALKSMKDATGKDDVGFMGSIDLGKLIPELHRGAKAEAGQDNLGLLTSETGGRRIPFRKQRDLEAGISAIGEELHTGYVLTYTPDRLDAGYHHITVKVGVPGVSVRPRPGYYISGADGLP